jgi:hypothetical protein
MERYRRIMRDEAQERIDEIQVRRAALREEMKARRKQARARADISDLKAEYDALSAELRGLLDAQLAAKTERHEARRAELNALNERAKSRIKRARQASSSMGLFWGSYNDIVGRADTGRKAGGLQFRRFTGDGTLTAQIMGGALASRCVEGDHSFFQVESVPGERWKRARMRIGSTADREPVWLDIPIILHRPVPPEAMIKSVSMTRRRGRWSLNITVTLPEAGTRESGPAVAVDIGWRLETEGVRVAYWQDTAGAHGEVMVSAPDLSQIGKVVSLRSAADKLRDEFLPAFAEWLKGRELSE